DGQPVGALAPGGRATVAVLFASWCPHCRDEMPVLAELARRHPDVRVLGLNYRGHEEYEQRGDAAAVRAFVTGSAPWLRVVPADERLWRALGRPAKVPTIYVFDRGGRRVRTFDRRREETPDLAGLEAVLPP
ncbi:MAG TPA: TlpA disulfide reductase family protein, partial [Kofleriaceae bacterium]|nr:TlpA disulfide reductase family protein [Kofleriaceae bacterium]